jgi:hypothetical protein
MILLVGFVVLARAGRTSQDAQEFHQVAQVVVRQLLCRPGLLQVPAHVTHGLLEGREAPSWK